MSKWIRVQDAVPEEGVCVLTYNSKDSIYSVDYIIEFEMIHEAGFIWANCLMAHGLDITHWMPLPEAPAK